MNQLIDFNTDAEAKAFLLGIDTAANLLEREASKRKGREAALTRLLAQAMRRVAQEGTTEHVPAA